jgi:hypothetical protein
MGKRKQDKINKLTADIDANRKVITETGEKLLAFGGSRATRSAILDRYTWAILENDRLQTKRARLDEPWWNRIGE